jgi:hypothetical protein
MESKAIARFARVAPRKARTVVNLVRGQKVSEAIDMLLHPQGGGADRPKGDRVGPEQCEAVRTPR